MAEDSTRRGGPTLGTLLVAVIFLAMLGGGVGYSLGTLSKHQRNAAANQADATTRQDSGTGGGNGTGGGGGSGTGGGQNSKQRCTAHTEEQAHVSPLHQLLYLHTAQSEVWICADDTGSLYYQGHRGAPGEQLVEGRNAIFLTDVARENGNGYVATNTDPAGPITKYHVTPRHLVREFINYQTPQPNQTEDALG